MKKILTVSLVTLALALGAYAAVCKKIEFCSIDGEAMTLTDCSSSPSEGLTCTYEHQHDMGNGQMVTHYKTVHCTK